MAEKDKVFVAEAVVAAVPAVGIDELLDVNEEDDWELESAVGLGEVVHVHVKRKLRGL